MVYQCPPAKARGRAVILGHSAPSAISVHTVGESQGPPPSASHGHFRCEKRMLIVCDASGHRLWAKIALWRL
eukprot:147102-Lingulodinium_polyedra.AAC.1